MTRCTMVTPDEARAIAQRFIDAYFDNDAERPRVSIPADPRRDDDLRLLAFIAQAEANSAALDEARRERDEAREAAGSDKLHLFGELKNARARESSERTWRERAEAQRDAAEAETFAARSELCALLSGHLSPSDAVRQSAISAAMETRRGWGM